MFCFHCLELFVLFLFYFILFYFLNRHLGRTALLLMRFPLHKKNDEVAKLGQVCELLYKDHIINHIPMIHERFHEVKLFNKLYQSIKSRGNHSSVICAYWAGTSGKLLESDDELYLQVGFFDTIQLSDTSEPISHIFVKVHWYQKHWRGNYFNHQRIMVVQPCVDEDGPATFIALSRVLSRCAVIFKTIEFDCGQDNVLIAIVCDQLTLK